MNSSTPEHTSRSTRARGATARRGAKAVQGMGESIASQVGSAARGMADTGSDLVSTATRPARTLVSELEDMTRRNPLGTIVDALMVGAILGMMSRGRG